MCIGFGFGVGIGAIQVWGCILRCLGRWVRIGCISLCVSRFFGAWWLHMIMVVIKGSSLVAILA